MAQIEHGQSRGAPSAEGLKETIVERICRLACVVALIVMLIVVGVDILTRSLFNFSFEISDELGGYLLVVIAFLSLPVCQVGDSFHHVELVQSRLSPLWRAVSHLIFDLLSLGFCGLLLWQLVRFEISSFRFADRAPTYLGTPLWIPQAVMALGAAALCFTMVRTLAADIVRLRLLARAPAKGSCGPDRGGTAVRRRGQAPINEISKKTAEGAGEP
jgi:TRAP-type C4-dicarboxylate transport system permease small subunit